MEISPLIFVLVLSLAALHSLLKLYRSAEALALNATLRTHQSTLLNDNQREIRAQYALRLCGLGLFASVFAILMVVLNNHTLNSLLPIIGLASISAIGVLVLKNAAQPKNIFAAILAVWVACIGYFASIDILIAILIALATAIAAFKSNHIEHSEQSNEAENTVAHIQNVDADEAGLANEVIVDGRGTIITAGKIGSLTLNEGGALIDHMHLTDRVSFLRLLSEVDGKTLQAEEISIRLNVAENGQTAHYVDVKLYLNAVETGFSVIGALDEVNQQPGQIDLTTSFKGNSDTQILAVVSHELRTPLNAIIGFSDILRGDLGKILEAEKREEYANLIHGAGTHLLSLVNTILDVSKIEAGAYEINTDEFEFSSTAYECISLLENHAMQKNITLNDRVSFTKYFVKGDRRAIKQVLINLLSNAVKYTNEGGIVTLDAKIENGNFTFEVSDTGVGMSGDEIEKLGKPFAQLDNSITRENEGTGLGLALVKGLVQLHDGTFSIISEKEIGTTVRVCIPLDTDNHVTQLHGSASNREDAKQALKQPHAAASTVVKGAEHGARRIG